MCAADPVFASSDPAIQAHTYHGTPAEWVTLRGAIASELGRAEAPPADPPRRRRATNAEGIAEGGARWPPRLLYAQGCSISDRNTSGFAAAIAAAASADAVVYAGGLEASLEEEDTDRTESLGLPGVQLDLIRRLRGIASARNVPLIVFLVSGGPISEPSLAYPSPFTPDALLWTSYFGQSARPLARLLLHVLPLDWPPCGWGHWSP